MTYRPDMLKREIDALLVRFPELANDAELFADVLEGETDFLSVVSRLVRQDREAQAMAEALASQITQMAERKARFGRQSEAARALIFSLMDQTGQRKVVIPEATLSIRNGTPRAIITDDEAIPDEYAIIKRAPDKAAIRDALKAGQDIPGAVLSNGAPSLSVRMT